MSRWLGPARCKACGAKVFYHPDFGWCDKPEPTARHRCPVPA